MNESPSAPSPRRARKLVLIVVAVALLSLPLLVRPLLIETFQMPSGSMIPTLLVGDHFFVNKTVGHPDRGDVIVFKYPLGPETSYIKRVVGLPGDRVAVVHGELQINGQAVPRRDLGEAESDSRKVRVWEEHLGRHTYAVHLLADRVAEFGPFQVPAGQYFVMGDNRDNSNDSRVWGPVPQNLVQGRATFVWFSSPPDGAVRWSRVGHAVE